MKKVLSILWVIIIVGTIFIAINLSKPEPRPEDISKTSTKTAVKEIPANNDENTNMDYQELIAKGDSDLEDGYTEKAIQSYKQAIKINPNSAEPLQKLGKSYLKNNQAAQAKTVFEQAIKLTPDIPSKLLLARAYFGLREINEAQTLINSLDQENPQVKYYRAIIAVLAKNFEQAESLFKELQDDNSKKFLNAFDTFSSYKEADPLFLQTLLAKSLTEAGEYDAAIPYLFDIINTKADYRDAWIILGYAYLNTNQTNDAIDALLKAKALNPDEAQTLFYLGLAYFANNNVDTAIKYLEAAEKAGYQPAEQLKLKLGDLYLIKENYQKSSKNYKELLGINPNNLDVFVRSIWLEIDKLNEPDKALKLAFQALEAHPNDAMSYNLVGWAYTANDDYNKAQEYLKKALEINPTFDAANLNFGWLYEKKGMDKVAQEYYKIAYQLGKGSSVGNLAAVRFNKISQKELSNYYKANISAPSSP